MPSDRNLFADLSVDPDIIRAWTLPASLYTEPSVLTHEHQCLFGRTWQVAGCRQQVARPGDYFTCQVAGEPLLVVRDGEGRLRAFYNVCRHRAGPPAEGCGSRKVFRCSYHGWTYGLDGRLITAPEFEGAQDFRAEDFGLRPVRVEEWAAWVFVNLDDAAEPLLPALGDLPRQAERFPLERVRFFERREYVMQCNWKTYVDNYLEGYHLPSVHPGLNRELDYGRYVTETFPRHSRQSSPIRGPENERDAPRRYPDAAGLAAEYFWIFPNWMLNCYPDNVSLNIVVPLAAEETLAIFEWYVLPELTNTEAAQAGVRFSHEIQLEDEDICEKVQRNLRSRSYERGRFSVRQEKGVHHFHRLYAEWMKRG
ncbi:MAG TPA: aromatic ring-hydroxylating dioxygenase subunit alpha [Terriglobales bacterium]|nr:aromatic ring-hydroxylating dioxygenase subunit alpha [Terriglobales bacterium]